MSTALSSLADLRVLVERFRAGDAPDAETVKSCCAAAYGVDLIALFLGESYHPGRARPDESPRRLLGAAPR